MTFDTKRLNALAKRLAPLFDLKNLVTLDFETFYSTEYSLTKKELNTSSYIRDERFKAHCLGIKIYNKATKCFETKRIGPELTKIDWSKTALLAHNTAFDGFILKEHYDVTPAFYLDTVSMSRGLHADVSRAKLDVIAGFYGIGEKSKTYLSPTKGLRDLPKDIYDGLAEGCIIDVDLCYELALRQLEVFPLDELRLIDMTIRMFCDSVLEVDINRAKAALAEEMIGRQGMIKRSGFEEADLLSNQKFGEALKSLGVEPPTKVSNTTGYETYAFAQNDFGFLELLEHEDARVVKLAEGRLAAKSTQVETRANRLIQAGETGKLPAGYNYYAAKTGRWGGTNKLNLQNLPRGSELRRSIIAPKDHVLVVTDSAQIEARVLAWLAGQQDVLDVFASGGDVYKRMAATIYGKAEKDVTKDERFVGKVAILGLGYGMGAKKFKTTLELGMMGPPVKISDKEAQRIVTLYRKSNSKIPAAWKIAEQTLFSMVRGEHGTVFDCVGFDGDGFWLPNGMPINYPGMDIHEDSLVYTPSAYTPADEKKYRKLYGGLAVENLVQALARIVVGEQALEVADDLAATKLKKGEVARISMLTHDEIVTCVPARLAEKQLALQLKRMQTPRSWCPTLPVDADGGFDSCYSK